MTVDIEKRRVYAIVDFDALDQNVQAMEEKLPQDVGMMAVIKTNAYGHGAKAIAKHLGTMTASAVMRLQRQKKPWNCEKQALGR